MRRVALTSSAGRRSSRRGNDAPNLPAGAVPAPTIARRLDDPRRRGWALGWDAFGLAHLVSAIALGSTACLGPGAINQAGPTTEMAPWPMALVPTFLVPDRWFCPSPLSGTCRHAHQRNA